MSCSISVIDSIHCAPSHCRGVITVINSQICSQPRDLYDRFLLYRAVPPHQAREAQFFTMSIFQFAYVKACFFRRHENVHAFPGNGGFRARSWRPSLNTNSGQIDSVRRWGPSGVIFKSSGRASSFAKEGNTARNWCVGKMTSPRFLVGTSLARIGV